MRLRGLARRETAVILVGFLGFSFGCAFCTGVDRGTGIGDASPGTQGRAGDADAPPEAEVCQPKQRGDGAKAELRLTAEVNTPLKFKCRARETLAPPGTAASVFAEVYGVTTQDGCDTNTKKTLLSEVPGASLLREPKKGRDQVPQDDPVYVFQYDTEPDTDKHVCYTCNTPAPSVGGTVQTSEESQVSCTVYITVPKKTPALTTPTTPTTPPPASTTSSNSTPDARAMTAFIVTATGGFLATML